MTGSHVAIVYYHTWQVVKRGARPLGGGEVVLRVPIMKTLPPISLTDEGMVKRIRGVAYSMKVSPQNTNRMVRRVPHVCDVSSY